MKNITIRSCFIRFEPNINDGTMFLFCKDNGKMLEGDYYSYIVIKSLMNKENLDILINNIASINNTSKNDVEEDIYKIFDILISKGIAFYE